jgi:hypothetical protein
MPVSGFHLRASIAVSDIARAVAFYEGKLGLQALHSGPSARIPDGGRVYGSGGGPALNVYQSVTAGKSPATLVTWCVDDIDQSLTSSPPSASSSSVMTHSSATPRASHLDRRWSYRVVSRTQTATPSPSKPTPERRAHCPSGRSSGTNMLWPGCGHGWLVRGRSRRLLFPAAVGFSGC